MVAILVRVKKALAKRLRTDINILVYKACRNEGVALMMYGYPEKWLEGMTTGEGIAAELRLGIVNGHIVEGTLLTENQMAKQFNVSRSPIRDAFKFIATKSTHPIRKNGCTCVAVWGTRKERNVRFVTDARVFCIFKS